MCEYCKEISRSRLNDKLRKMYKDKSVLVTKTHWKRYLEKHKLIEE